MMMEASVTAIANDPLLSNASGICERADKMRCQACKLHVLGTN